MGTLKKTKSVAGRDEGDGLRKGLLATNNSSSSRSLFGGLSTSSEGKSRVPVAEEAELDLSPDAPMVDVVKAIIRVARVENAVWTEGNSHKKWQVSLLPCPVLPRVNLHPLFHLWRH